MQLNNEQIAVLSQYLADLSKIIFASTIVSFFLPQGTTEITPAVFLTGSAVATTFLILSVSLLKKDKYYDSFR